MEAASAKAIGQRLTQGFQESLEGRLSRSYAAEMALVEERVDSVEEFVRDRPVALCAALPNSGGGLVCLLNEAQALRLAALAQELDPAEKPQLEDMDLGVLRELASAILGQGFKRLLAELGQEGGALENIRVLRGKEAAAEVGPLVGEAPAHVAVEYEEDGEAQGAASFLFSESFADLAPELEADAADQASGGKRAKSHLSQDEMNDILSGFGEDPVEEEEPSAPSPAPAANLDMVMDIGLVVTARLGGIDMPISEILNLGPGSIIEMNHLVDEPVELLINGKLIARGEVVVVEEKFGLRITEIVSTRQRIESLR